MKIIDKVEINYFRSAHGLILSNCNDINVFIGGNDAGKSNILKALNLFFNNRTDIDEFFDFRSDLSRLREEEARAAKGRATIWVRVTFNNFLGWRTLPEKFSVKRTWNRYQQSPSDTYPKGTPGTTIGKFLNKLSFHYIPAIRGPDIFSHYLIQLHDSLIEDEKAGVRLASSELMNAINRSTEDMSERIREGLGFESTIKIPEDLTDLFETLDFSTNFSGYNISLQHRGDGIQGRHIPFILDFIARHSNRHHLWAYEEPENSLELSKAFELADQFDEEFRKENQIFVTTHSPAFYDLSGDHVTKWFVQQQKYLNEDKLITTASPIQESETADQRLGIAALVAERARELHQELTQLRETNSILSNKVAEASRAIVVVEGPTDQRILAKALECHSNGRDQFCEFAPANGASNVGSFIRTLSRMNNPGSVPIIGLVDNDAAGRKEAASFKTFRNFDKSNFKIVSLPEKIYFGTLPVPDEFEVVDLAIKRISGQGFSLPLCIEFMFPKEVIEEALGIGVLSLKDRYATARDNELALPINLTKNYSDVLPDGFEYFAQEISDENKRSFSDWVCKQNSNVFRNFDYLLSQLRQIAAQG